ncbi:MAG: DUF47 family protein [Candidatus Sumerlaeota bacterium]|nr:DUF47 family protein [Candidatus Sumerlaeota bacterium]
MFRHLLPRNTDFFNYFEQLSGYIAKTCQELQSLTRADAELPVLVGRIKDLEHEADKVTHRCIEALHKTFITPIDRNDIHSLIKGMDSIVDAIDATVSRLAMYEIARMRPDTQHVAALLLKAAEELDQAIRGLRDLKNSKAIMDRCIALHQIETEGDALLRKGIVRLFKEERDTLAVIKWKEIYERLEKAVDRCDDVANIIEGIVVEAS